MKCHETRKLFPLYYDSEGDAEVQLQIGDHLGMCPDCARWFFEQGRLEDTLVRKLREGQPTKPMWDRIGSQCVSSEPVAERHWTRFNVSLFLAACAAMIIIGVWYLDKDAHDFPQPDLTGLSVALHEDLASGREAVKLASRSPTEVEDYLQKEVSFPVRCPPRDDAGFQLEGGGVCHFNTDPVAYVVGEVNGRRVSVFILPRESLVRFPPLREALRGHATFFDRRGDCGVVIKEIDQNLVLVVGSIESQQLMRVLKAYGSYQEHEATPPDSPSSIDQDV